MIKLFTKIPYVVKICFLLLLISTTTIHAQSLRFITPWAVGGGIDSTARLLADQIDRKFQTKTIVENKPGANGILALDTVITSTGDRVSLLIDQTTLYLNPFLYPDTKINPFVDLMPIAQIAEQYSLFTINPSAPFKNFADFLHYAKKTPDKITFGYAGYGHPTYIILKMFKEYGGIKFFGISYKTSMSTMLDIVSGQIDVGVINVAAATPLIHYGKLRPLARLSNKLQTPEFIALPTVDSYIKNINESTSIGVFAKNNLNKETRDQLQTLILEIVKSPEFREKIKIFGNTAYALTGDQLMYQVNNDLSKWLEILKTK